LQKAVNGLKTNFSMFRFIASFLRNFVEARRALR
jgi:hypothetical protein